MNTARATLPRSARLRGAARFTGRFSRRYSSQHFLLLTRSGGTKDGGARLGIVIGRRQVAGAVERSYLRRMIRETFRICRTGLGQVDVVVRCRVGPAPGLRDGIRRELADLFGRIAS